MGNSLEKGNKILLLMRHGERADAQGYTPIFGRNDTEITEKGKKLAVLSGINIAKKLNELGYNKEDTKIQIISSPFVRALQTSIGVKEGILKEGYNINEIIKIDCNLSDGAPFHGEYPKNFLNIFNQNKEFKKEFKDDKFEFLNGIESLSKPNENSKEIANRMVKAFELFKNILTDEYNIYISVTSAWPMVEYGKLLGFKEIKRWQEYKYYDSIIFKINENKEGSFIEKCNMAGI